MFNERISRRSVPEWIFPLALLALLLLTYGPFLNQLGYYWDDWVFAWIRIHLGAPGLRAYFADSRPLRGWVEPLLTPLLGLNPSLWQAFSLAMRWLAGLAFWWFLRQLWPQRKFEAFFAAAIFLVYPGFTQQPLAMVYGYFWVIFAVFFLSLGFMVRSLRGERPIGWVYILSVLLCALQVISLEYLAGLELLRPLLLWLVLGRQPESEGSNSVSRLVRFGRRPKKVVLWELPYALPLVGYVYWHFLPQTEVSYTPDLLNKTISSPLQTLGKLGLSTLNAIVDINLKAWFLNFHLPAFGEIGPTWTLVYLVAVLGVLVGGTLFFCYSSPEKPPASAPQEACFPFDGLVISLVGMLLAGLPFFIASLPFRLSFPEDRFTFAFLPLVGMFLAGLVALLSSRSQRALVAALILTLAVSSQFQTLLLYRDAWKVQRAFLWQLVWRAPALESGTNILSEDEDTFHFNDDEALAAMLNWTYAPSGQSLNTYGYSFISLRYGASLTGLLKTTATKDSNFLVIRYAPPSCLHILDPVYDAQAISLPASTDLSALDSAKIPVIPYWTKSALPLSNLNRIEASAGQSAVPPAFLGAEPEHSWCYYYEKADLARQQGDWQRAAHIGDQAFAVPYYPDDPSEYLLFVEAYARTGRLKEAHDLADRVSRSMPVLKPALCAVWQRVAQTANLSDAQQAILSAAVQALPFCSIHVP